MYGCVFMRLGKIISFFLACIIFSTSFIAIPVTSEETVMTLQEEIIISVDSTNLRFSPAEVTIVEGQTVRFFWDGELLGHNAVEMNGFFDSGEPPAKSFSKSYQSGPLSFEYYLDNTSMSKEELKILKIISKKKQN